MIFISMSICVNYNHVFIVKIQNSDHLKVKEIKKTDRHYTGGRTSPEIVNWLRKKTGPPCIALKDVDGAKKFVEKDDVVVIGFFKVNLLLSQFMVKDL